jgi:hypothetical protein
VIVDPKLLVAGLCIVIASIVFALMMRALRSKRRLRAVLAPRGQAAVGMRQTADISGSTVQLRNNGAKTIAIIHDFDNPTAYDANKREYLSAREAFEVLAEIRSAGKDTPIDIILHTPGGDRFAGEMIATALKDRPNTTAYVPYCAMSAGTMIALSTEKVVMGNFACLGPIDSQFAGFPADSFERLLKEKPIQHISDFWLMVSYYVEKDLKTARGRACELMNRKHFAEPDACALTDFLVSGDLPHSERIHRERAAELGVNVAKDDCPAAVYQIVESRLELLRSMQGQNGFDPGAKMKPAQ